MKKIFIALVCVMAVVSIAFAANHPISVLMKNYGGNLTKGMLISPFSIRLI